MNPNYTPEIALLIRQCNNLKHNTQTPHSQETKERIQALNQEINKQIQDKKTENWRSFLETLNHSTNITHLYKTIKSITNSNSGITPSHAAITTTGTIPSHTKQADILIDHYANISHLKPTKDDRAISRRRHKFKLNNTLSPITTAQTTQIIKRTKNSRAAGPDDITNLHLKHLGPHGVQALTNISNYSYQHCKIPTIWKKGKIITILKPKKDPTQAASYRPITLLCTPSKIIERHILHNINPHILLSPTQHGFRPNHSTNTLLTNLTQHTFDGINCKRPAQRTILATVDISKAFDAIPRFPLTDKIYNTTMPNNTKRWLANYLSGRQSYVSYNNKSSHTRILPNGVPQGSVLSPTLFNLYMHDIPTPIDNRVQVASYADDITIISTHNNVKTATTLLQHYINRLETWLGTNRLKVAPAKSTVTLLTSDT